MKVKKIDLSIPIDSFKKKKSKNPEYEVINNVLLSKSRLDTVLTVDSKGTVIAISGNNPKDTKIGDNIYE